MPCPSGLVEDGNELFLWCCRNFKLVITRKNGEQQTDTMTVHVVVCGSDFFLDIPFTPGNFYIAGCEPIPFNKEGEWQRRYKLKTVKAKLGDKIVENTVLDVTPEDWKKKREY